MSASTWGYLCVHRGRQRFRLSAEEEANTMPDETGRRSCHAFVLMFQAR